MSVKVVLGVRLLRWRPVHVLALPVRRTVAAVRGGPTVSTAVGLAQRQVSAVPLTVAVQSRNQQEAKNQCSTEREEQTRAAGQKQAQPTQRGARESTFDRSTEVMQKHQKQLKQNSNLFMCYYLEG